MSALSPSGRGPPRKLGLLLLQELTHEVRSSNVMEHSGHIRIRFLVVTHRSFAKASSHSELAHLARFKRIPSEGFSQTSVPGLCGI